MFERFRHYPWVLPLYEYESQEQLIEVLREKVIGAAEQEAKELQKS